MEGIAGLAMILLLGLGGVAVLAAIGRASEAESRRQQDRRRQWRDLAAELGLSNVGQPDEPLLRGRAGDFDVFITPLTGDASNPAAVTALLVKLDSGGAWPEGFRAGDSFRVGKWPGAGAAVDPMRSYGSDVEVGPAGGDDAARLAVLDGRTRRAWSEIVDAEHGDVVPARIAAFHGSLVALQADARPQAPALARRLERLSRLARALDRRGRSLARCLADGLADASDEERRERLQLLALRFAKDPATPQACARHLGESDPATRLFAAMGAGTAGGETLRDLARDAGVAEDLRLQALERWSADAPLTRASSSLIALLLREGPPSLRRAALEAARRRGDALPVELLTQLARSLDGDDSVALARLLAAAPRPEHEPALLELLRRRERAVKDEALRALRDAGTIACVRDVAPLADGALGAPETRLLAREAIRAVRARLGNPEAGRLDLAGGDLAGMLDLPASPGGEVSPAPADGALSRDDDSLS